MNAVVFHGNGALASAAMGGAVGRQGRNRLDYRRLPADGDGLPDRHGDGQEPKNLTLKMGNCNHRKYIPHLVDLVAGGSVAPENVLTKIAPLAPVLEAYKAFDQRRPGWIKVELRP
jgi:hypothetical protein